MRLSQPKDPSPSELEIAQILLAVHAERRAQVKHHDGYWTWVIYKSGIPAQVIADAYGTSLRNIHSLLRRHACEHELGDSDCTNCGKVETPA